MENRSEAERLGVLEALRKEHESRHERYEKHIDERFDGLETLIKNGNGQRGSLRRHGPSLAGGGGFVAIVYLLIDKLVLTGV